MRKIIFVVLCLSCISTAYSQRDVYVPVQLEDGWKVDTITSTTLNRPMLRKLLDEAATAEPSDLRGLVVVQNGKLVMDEYYNSFWWENILDIRSAGKSVTAILGLIAIDKGLFDLDTKVISLFPEYADHDNPSPQKSGITIEHLLTMSSGLDADSDNSNSPGSEENWFPSKDYVKLILDLPMAFEPGSKYVYNSACAMLLGAAIEKVSGKTMKEFGQEHLFGPMNFGDFFWQWSPAGRTTGMGNLYIRVREMAKIGQLMASGGKWNGKTIVSEHLIKKALTHHQDITTYPEAAGYGYMWYMNSAEIKGETIQYYFASGNGGNKIFVVPSINLVVAVGQTAYGTGYSHRRASRFFGQILEAGL